MAGRQPADVVYCVDASGSMGPCFAALRRQIQSFVRGLHSNPQIRWDLRLDFLAYQAGASEGGGTLHAMRSLYHDGSAPLMDGLYQTPGQQSAPRFFSSDVDEFARGLEAVSVAGDEATFIALDTALDFPWREKSACHRILVLLTDEPLETGVDVATQAQRVSDLIDKIHELKVKLFLVAPASPAFDQLSAADGSEYEVVEDTENGLQTVDFAKVLEQIGKSVSVSTLQGQPNPDSATRALFGQSSWVSARGAITGR